MPKEISDSKTALKKLKKNSNKLIYLTDDLKMIKSFLGK